MQGPSHPSPGPPANPEPSRAAEGEVWAWMVNEDPAFYLEEAGATSKKKAG